ERHSPALQGTPMDRLIDEWREVHPDFVEHVEPLLLSSFTGIFEVGDLVERQGAWLRDITGFGEFALQEPRAATELRTGDLLVGRLYPVPGSLHVASGHSVWMRSPELSKALQADLNRLYGEGAKILRLSAPELETMFFHPTAPHRKAQRPTPTESTQEAKDAILEAREFLTLAGWSRERINEFFDALRRNPVDPAALAASPEDPVGQALELFAFETQVDLTEARRILTQASLATSRLQVGGEAPKEACDELTEETQAALARIAAARASGADMEPLIQELELSLGLPIGGEDEDPGQAPDFPGVVGAMVSEFQWDLERQGKGDAKRGARLQPFAEYCRTIGAFEDLSRREVLTFCCFWSQEQRLFHGDADTLETLDALEAFTHWAQEEHEMPLHDECAELLAKLATSLPRIVRLNRSLSPRSANDGDAGQLYTVAENPESNTSMVWLDRSGEPCTANLPEGLGAALEPGDLVRAQLDWEGPAKVFCAYPPEASELHRDSNAD
ncbi:MAG: hypothetical protein KDB61_10090, partial [Planctomycetes bacterium]|nr:hypothetical protein [Planctomycetota bacterium]